MFASIMNIHPTCFYSDLRPNLCKVQWNGIKLTKIIGLKNPSVFKLHLLVIEARLV